MTLTTAPPAVSEAVDFYVRALPLAEQLLAMARQWRDCMPLDPAAIEAHGAAFRLVLLVDLRLARSQRAGPRGPLLSEPEAKP